MRQLCMFLAYHCVNIHMSCSTVQSIIYIPVLAAQLFDLAMIVTDPHKMIILVVIVHD